MTPGDFLVLLAVAHSLLHARTCNASSIAQHIARCGSSQRRVNPYTQLIINALSSGGASQLAQIPQLAAEYFATTLAMAASTASDRHEREPWGPADNGAAALIPPVALAYATASPTLLEAAVREACTLSHPHPLVGVSSYEYEYES